MHKTENPDIVDYFGNGISLKHKYSINHPKYPFHFAVQKYGLDNFKRETIAIFDNEKDAFKLEEELVTPAFINRDDNYNCALGGGRSKTTKGPVYQFDLNGNFIKMYDCINNASALTQISVSAITTGISKKVARRGCLWSHSSTIDINEYHIKRSYIYYVYNKQGDCEIFKSRKELLNKYNLDSSNLSRAIKRGIKIHGLKISIEPIKN